MSANRARYLTFALILATVATRVIAGPPFFTDDPEPVEPHHGEFYVATQDLFERHSSSGTGPHFEFNYGPVEDVHLHAIVPLSYNHPATPERAHYGLGDIELGLKYRFVHETDSLPQIGTFPLFELPTGKAKEGLGNGRMQVFLPLWLQKSFGGKWTTYGGGGYWINPGTGNQNFGFAGWVIQRKMTEKLVLGNEIFHSTASQPHGRSHTGFNFGGNYDVNESHHFLFSAGRDISGPRKFTGYAAYQFTF